MGLTFSAVIPIRGNSGQLRDCLDSLSGQTRLRDFEVIVVDDGSEEPVHKDLGRDYIFPLKVIRQVPLGVSAARNSGIHNSTGEIVLFVDSDVVLDVDFLERLAESVEAFPDDLAFQASLRSGKGNLVERMECLRLTATLPALKNGAGYVKYANTSAFAVRRSLIDPQRDFFDLSAVRGEDTRVLADMLRRGMEPRLAARARALHRPRMALFRYITKHFWIGYHTTPSRDILLAECDDVLLGNNGRKVVFKHMLADAVNHPAELLALPLIALAYSLERFGRTAYRLLGLRHGPHEILTVSVDGIRADELVARIVTSAERGKGKLITYLTAWTLVQATGDRSMSTLLRNFDICYPDGMGVVLSALLLGGRRLHKVTANNFINKLCEQAELQKLSVALVGAKEEIIGIAANELKARYPGMNLVGFSQGYLNDTDDAALRKKLISWKPHLVIVGMGQPRQEKWAWRTREVLPGTVFLCVGGLFDYLSGDKPTPPKLIRKVGLEWLFILLRRPRRFWKRYLFGLPMLALLIATDYISRVPALFQPRYQKTN